ncbi:MAG: SurA N-terminal domain-containing protein [Dechloromonas sp.]|nr:SurA N-terminal domain-containing protein [Dechloromonas sp.]
MFDAVRNSKRIVQVFLALIMLPFAFFGVESYVNNSGQGGDVASIGDIKITQQEFQQVLRDQQERLRAQTGQSDPKMLDNPQIRQAILDDLINQRLLLLEANRYGLLVSDDAVRQSIAGLEAFQVDGKFSNERYESLLRAQGMSPAGFEARMRHDLTLQQLAGGIGQSGLMSRTVSERILAMQTEKRLVAEVRLPVETYLPQVKLAADAVQKFYDDNGERFATPEQAKVEYLVLSMATMAEQLTVSHEEIKAWYDSHKDRYQQAEERRASHILIASEKLGADQARAKAEDVLAEVRKNPAVFADLARKYSNDPGSATQGGDLGFFGQGMMVKPFEEATFALKVGEISGVVPSDFGFHIIRLTDIHPAKEKPLSAVRDDIIAELKNSAASRKFAEAAESFSNLVYEQSDSLKPAAEQFKLTVKHSDWLGRRPNPALAPLDNEKLLAALFADDAVKNKRNTEAVEVAPNTLVAARIVDYKPSARQPLAEVKSAIETLLQRQEALALARQEGETRLAALRQGEDRLSWSVSKAVSRLDARALPAPAIQPVFRMASDKLPAYAGVEIPGAGYLLLKLSKIEPGEAMEAARKQGILSQLTNLKAQEDVQNYLAALRQRYKVAVHAAALEPQR